MATCLVCGFEAKNGAGLSAHRRAKHGRRQGPNRRAAEETLAELRRMGRLEEIDAARVQTIRSIADALDVDDTNAQLWRTYREAIEDLMRADDDADDALTKALAEIAGATAMGDPPEA